MNPISIAIVEDEFTIAFDLQTRLTKKGYDVCGVALNYQEAIELVLEKKPNLVLLDINLEDEKSGFDVAQKLQNNPDTDIVFLTAYKDEETFAEASKYNPVAFLNKPFRDDEIHWAIQLAFKNAKNTKPEDSTKSIENIFVKVNGELRKVNLCDIFCLKAVDNYTQILLENEKLMVHEYLSAILEKLDNKFARIHRSHAVSIDRITLISENTIFCGKHYAPMSKTYKEDILKRLNII